jgi:threonine dehydrogenase-like Zn-dependent dehydrogenase
MRGPNMAGAFPFPVKYGYALVARVEEGPPTLRERTVFALHPHQDLCNVSADWVVPLLQELPPARAVLAANMETALNAVWDGAPGPADRIAVVGGGVVGALIARLCARLPAAEVTLIDIVPARAGLAKALGVRFASPAAGSDVSQPQAAARFEPGRAGCALASLALDAGAPACRRARAPA